MAPTAANPAVLEGKDHGFAKVDHGIVGLVYNEAVVLHTFDSGFVGNGGRRLVPAQHRFDPGHQFFGIKGLFDVVVRAQFQPQHFVKNLPLGGEHDNGDAGAAADFPADLVTVDAGKHQVQQD